MSVEDSLSQEDQARSCGHEFIEKKKNGGTERQQQETQWKKWRRRRTLFEILDGFEEKNGRFSWNTITTEVHFILLL